MNSLDLKSYDFARGLFIDRLSNSHENWVCVTSHSHHKFVMILGNEEEINPPFSFIKRSSSLLIVKKS